MFFFVFDKDVMVVETDWPAIGSCPGVSLSENSISISTNGQIQWVNGIKNVLNQLPGGHGIGFVYWEPGWIGNAGLGSSCSVSVFFYSIEFNLIFY